MRVKDFGSLTVTAIRIVSPWSLLSAPAPLTSLPQVAIIIMALLAVGCVLLRLPRRYSGRVSH